jgi:hypothetical protein
MCSTQFSDRSLIMRWAKEITGKVHQENLAARNAQEG